MSDPAKVRYAVIILSDRSHRGEREDKTGPVAAEILTEALGSPPAFELILPDDADEIRKKLIDLSDAEGCDLVVTAGGTGLSPRDVTPEATLSVIDRQVPGMAEAMRAEGLRHTPTAMLSRAVCGQRGKTLIVNLSGSPKAVREQLAVIIPALPHALDVARGSVADCGR